MTSGVYPRSEITKARMGNAKQKRINFVVNENGCHVCTSHAGPYPTIMRNGRDVRISHFIYEQKSGKAVPEGMQICHRCDNPKCINFDHIFLGTQSDNNLDKIFKGREKNVHGTAHYAAKLTEEDVMKIRSDNRTMEEIAKDYNVAPSTVNCVKLRQTWKHIA